MVPVVHHQQLVDAGMVGEELVGLGDGIPAKLLLAEGVNLAPRRQQLRDAPPGVALLHDAAGQQAGQFTLPVHHRERAEGKPPFGDQLQHLPDQLLRRHLDRLLNQPMHVVLHAADFGKLLPLRHIVVDQPQPAVERQRDCHARLAHRVHIGRDDRNVQLQSLRQQRVELRVPGQNLRVHGRQRYIVIGQPDTAVGREESVCRFVEPGIEVVGLFGRWHVGKCQRQGLPGKLKEAPGFRPFLSAGVYAAGYAAVPIHAPASASRH